MDLPRHIIQHRFAGPISYVWDWPELHGDQFRFGGFLQKREYGLEEFDGRDDVD